MVPVFKLLFPLVATSVMANQIGSEFADSKYQTREHIKTRTLIEECVAHCKVEKPYEYSYLMKPIECMADSYSFRRGFNVVPDSYSWGLCPSEGKAAVSLKKIIGNRFGEKREVFFSCTFEGNDYKISQLTKCGE